MSQIQDTNATGDQDVNNNTQWNKQKVLDITNSGDNVEPKECEESESENIKSKLENSPSTVVHLRNLPLSSNSNLNYSNNNYYIQHNDDVEGDIIKVAFEYGVVIDILMMRKTGQAFLQMETLEQAQNFVNSYKDRTIHVGTHSVYVQFSKYPRLTGIDNNTHQIAIRKRLEDAKNGKFYKQMRHRNSFNDGFRGQQNIYNRVLYNGGYKQVSDGNRRVLHVTVEDYHYPVSIHTYGQLFSKQGKVLRIVMYKKQNNQRAPQKILLEMADPESAQSAKRQFNNQMMYQGSHLMRIDFSHLPELSVKADDEQRWDYIRSPVNLKDQDYTKMQKLPTNYNQNFQTINNHRNMTNNNFQNNQQTSWSPNDRALKTVNSTQMNNINFNHQNSNQSGNCNSHIGSSNSPNINGGGNGVGGGNINQQHLNNTQTQPTNYYNQQNNYTNQQNISHGYNQPFIQQQYSPFNNCHLRYDQRLQNQHNYYRTNNHIPSPNSQYSNQIYYDSKPNIHPPNHYNINHHQINNPTNNQHHYHAHKNNLQHDPRYNNFINYPPNYNTLDNNHYGLVLCASNLNEEDTKPDDLFTLFGVYGDVARVKILYEKRDTALIEFMTSMQANQAITHLNGKRLHGKELKIKVSKFQKVNMPKEGNDTYKLTKEYLNSPLHRYRKQGSKNYSNIYEVCEILHLSNIPEGYTKEKLESIFENYGSVKSFRFFKDPKMALVKMASVDEAITCLINTHNHKMSANQHLRVSFSRGYCD